MFNDIGPLELVTLVVLAVLVFGPEKLPKVIQDATRFIRKIREFADTAKEDIKSELGPEFKDFEFEDLNPKTFVRKHLTDGDEDTFGLKEIRSSFDLRKEITEVADAVNNRDDAKAAAKDTPMAATTAVNGSTGTPDLLKKRENPDRDDRPPFDADAT
ncbi:sec-independent translocase [Streptomyces liangshanensis]|uniref:sec-independent translocase n=1 Tax=Streptomyces liangshanensis TaxID=2717324 RepID=UPI0036D802DE